LGRVTMGSLGFSSLFDSERLPPLLRNGDTINNLVQIGSGNTTPGKIFDNIFKKYKL